MALILTSKGTTMQNIEFAIHLVREPISTKSDNWQDTAKQWKATFTNNKNCRFSQSFDYFTGSAITSTPTVDEVLGCLISDAMANELFFDDWCYELGYDTDSRKALQTYLAGQEICKKLHILEIDIAAERERLEGK
jgi:hypothetical protein